MSKEFQLTFRSDDANTANQSELQRIMSLAGIAMLAPDTQPEQACDTCSDEDMSDEHMQVSAVDDMADLDEEQAEYDHGHQDIDQAGHEVDQDTYIWNAPKLPQRIVKGTQGDNPLISEIHNRLLEQYNEFLTEDESRENEDGTLSPLSDPTKPEFDKDPLSGEPPVDDGSHSPMSTIARQSALK